MSTLHDELAAGSGTGCKVCHYLSGLRPADQAEWDAELRQPVKVIGNTAVVNALAKRGLDVTEAAVRRHRGRHVVAR